MTTTHAGCFGWYGKCKHMNRIWVTIERMCKWTGKKIGYRQQIGIEHQDLQCKRGPRWPSGQDLGNQMSPQHKLLVHLVRGELAPRLSLVSPKVFFSISVFDGVLVPSRCRLWLA